MKKAKEICPVDGCGLPQRGKRGFCNRHAIQMRRHGRIFDKTRFDLNEIYEKDGCCYMKLYNKNNEVVAETIFDPQFLPEVEKYRWNLTHYGYAKCMKIKMGLHNIVAGMVSDDQRTVDHINGERLDNRSVNLRICSFSENAGNKVKSRSNKSGYKGIYQDRKTGKWVAAIAIGGKKISLGWHKNLADAVAAYDEAAKAHFKEFARPNGGISQ